MSFFNEQMLEILACPKCKSAIRLTKNGTELVCTSCKASYPVVNEIPILLSEEGDALSYKQYAQTATESIEFYDEMYRDQFDYRRFAGPDRSFAQQIFRRLDFSTKSPVVVDLGAGTGYFGKLFEEYYPHLLVYNADFSIEGFRTAQQVYGLENLAVMDAYNPAFLADSLDAVFTIGLTPFKKKELKDISFLIERLVEPLKRGGYYVFVWSSNLRNTVEAIHTVRDDLAVTDTYYYNHSRPFIEQAFHETGLFESVVGYTFLRPAAMLLGPLQLSQPVTWLTEAGMRFAPHSLTARMVIIGRKR